MTLLTIQDIENFIYGHETFELAKIQPHFVKVVTTLHNVKIYIYFLPESMVNMHRESLQRLMAGELKDYLPVTAFLKGVYVRKFEPLNPHEIYSIKELIQMDFFTQVNGKLGDLIENQRNYINKFIRQKKILFIVYLIIAIIQLILFIKIIQGNQPKGEIKKSNKIEAITKIHDYVNL